MKELLNLEGYGLRLEYDAKEVHIVENRIEPKGIYTVIDSADVFEYTTEYDNRAEAVSHIVTDILNINRVYDEESLPDDLARAYTAVAIAERSTMSRTRDTAYTFLFYVLDDIAVANEYRYRKETANE